MKKSCTVVSIILIVLFVLTSSALADGERQSGAFTYRIKGNGTAAITSYKWPNSIEDIYIPRMLDGYTVTEIAAEAFANLTYDSNGHLARNTIDSAREWKPEYTVGSLVIPDTVTTIGEKAFWGLYFQSKSITIPSSVQYIGAGAFSNIKGVEQFTVVSNPVYASIDGVLYHKPSKALIAIPIDIRLESGKLYHQNSEKVYVNLLTIPDGVISIADYAFFGMGDAHPLLLVTIPQTTKHIGNWAFSHSCIATNFIAHEMQIGSKAYLEPEIVLSETISHIGEGAFYKVGDTTLYHMIDLQATQVTEIPSYAFAMTASEFKFPSKLQIVGTYAFYDAFLWDSFLPETLVQIKEFAFSKADFGSSLQLAELSKLKVIENSAFYQASTTIGSLILPEGLEEIGHNAFAEMKCHYLSTLSIPSTVRSIGDDICNRNDVYLEVVPGSYAALWAYENGYMIQNTGDEDTSWLN